MPLLKVFCLQYWGKCFHKASQNLLSIFVGNRVESLRPGVSATIRDAKLSFATTEWWSIHSATMLSPMRCSFRCTLLKLSISGALQNPRIQSRRKKGTEKERGNRKLKTGQIEIEILINLMNWNTPTIAILRSYLFFANFSETTSRTRGCNTGLILSD